jgi:NAD-dependent deacetylase
MTESIRTTYDQILQSKHMVTLTGQNLISLPVNNEIVNLSNEDIMSIHFFEKDPEAFYNFFWNTYKHLNLIPNSFHYKLFQLGTTVITQSFDGLHYKAGSTDCIELHGNIKKMRCTFCNYYCDTNELHLRISLTGFTMDHVRCPLCNNILKPDIVLYGEVISNFIDAVEEINRADLLLILGLDLDIWPSNKLVLSAQENNCSIISIEKGDVSSFISAL